MKVELFNEKALTRLRQIEDSSINLILTDPPYNVDLDYDEYDDTLDEEEYWEWMQEIIFQCQRVVKETGAIAFVTPSNQRREWTEAFDKLNFQELGGSPVIWCRNNCVGGGGGFCHSFDYATYFIHVYTGEDFKINNEPPADAEVTSFNWVVEPAPQSNFEKEKRQHPAQQPERVYEKILLNCSYKEDKVLDPFTGSGTTGVVCKRWSRDFIGCEISEDYLEDARKRISKTEAKTRQLTL